MIEESTTLSWDKKAGICQQWQACSLSISKFCKQKKIALSTFKGWCACLCSLKRKCDTKLLSLRDAKIGASPQEVSNAPSTCLPNSICSRAKSSNSLISMRSGSKEIGSISLRLNWWTLVRR